MRAMSEDAWGWLAVLIVLAVSAPVFLQSLAPAAKGDPDRFGATTKGVTHGAIIAGDEHAPLPLPGAFTHDDFRSLSLSAGHRSGDRAPSPVVGAVPQDKGQTGQVK